MASVALLATGALTACGGGGTPAADSGSKTIRVTLANHVWTDTIKSKLPEFEKATGLKVELSQYGEDQASAAGNYVRANAGTNEIDVMMAQTPARRESSTARMATWRTSALT